VKLPRLGAVIACAALVPAAAAAQRAVAPLSQVPVAARIAMPDLVAVRPDSTYQLVVPSLFERKAVYRQVAGEWTLVETIFRRDSTRAASLVGRAAEFYIDGQPVGSGHVRSIQPGFCGDPPAWCPTRATIDIVGSLMRDAPPMVVVSPPPVHTAETVEPSEDEVAAVSLALLGLLRTAAGPRQRVSEDQLGTPTVYTINDIDSERRIVVAAGALDLGATGSVSGLVVGIAADTLLRSTVGRATRRPPGSTEELRLVTAMDLNGDGRDELLLGWVSAGDWTFEVLSPDRLGRYKLHFRGPDRSMPAMGARRTR